MNRKSLKAEPGPVPRFVLKAGWLCLPVEQKQEKWQLLPCEGLRLCKVPSLQGLVIRAPENALNPYQNCASAKGIVDSRHLLLMVCLFACVLGVLHSSEPVVWQGAKPPSPKN